MTSATTESYLGVIDQCTIGTRFVIFDGEGAVDAVGFEPHTKHSEPPYTVEYDPEEIWQCVRAAIQSAMASASIEPGDLTALGIATQRQTVVLWDERTGEPVSRAIGWQDRRAREVVDDLDAEERAYVRERTGLIPDPYFAAPTLASVLADDRDIRERARAGDIRYGTMDTWLLSRLTGRHRTDITNAAQTMLVDTVERVWDEALLEIFGVPRALLPSIHPSSDPEAYGRTDVGGLLDVEIPVTGVLGDQQAALVGHGGFEPGATKISYGAGNFILQNVGRERPPPSEDVLSTIWFQEAGEDPYFALEAPIFTTGTMIEWLDELGMLECDGEPEMPTDVTANGRVPKVIPSIAGGGAPSWCQETGGGMYGLGRHDDSESIVLGAVDGIGFATRSALEVLEARSGQLSQTIHVDGIGVQDDRVASRQATLLGRDLVRPATSEAAAQGAAFTAGLAIDVWPDTDALSPEAGRCFTADGDPETVTEMYEDWSELRDLLRESMA